MSVKVVKIEVEDYQFYFKVEKTHGGDIEEEWYNIELIEVVKNHYRINDIDIDYDIIEKAEYLALNSED